MSDQALFAVVRAIVGRGLTQDEVNRINSALASVVIAASPSRDGRGASRAAIDLIHSFETLRLVAYKDPGSANGLPITNGWGSTTDLQGQPIKLGTVWTKEYADAKFAQDLASFETGVNILLSGRPATQNQFDALISFAYNVGLDVDADAAAEGLGDSTLLRKHLAGDYSGAQAAFAAWNKNDVKVMKGLIRRRAAEAALYGAAA